MDGLSSVWPCVLLAQQASPLGHSACCAVGIHTPSMWNSGSRTLGWLTALWFAVSSSCLPGLSPLTGLQVPSSGLPASCMGKNVSSHPSLCVTVPRTPAHCSRGLFQHRALARARLSWRLPTPQGRLTLLTPQPLVNLYCIQGRTAHDRCVGAHNTSILKREHSFCEIIFFISIKDTGPLCSGPTEGDVGHQ